MKITTNWDEENGITIYRVSDGEKCYVGVSECHTDDKEFQSQEFGEALATVRATLDFLRKLRDNEIIPQLKIIKHLYTNMTTSKQYNPKSYEATMIRRKYHQLQGQYNTVRDEIHQFKDQEAYLIDTKESLNTLIRSKSDNK